MTKLFFLALSFLNVEPEAPVDVPEAATVWSTEALGGGRARVILTLTIPDGYHIDLQPDFLFLDVEPPHKDSSEALTWSVPGLRQGVPSFSGSLTLSRVVYGLGGAQEVSLTAGYQICNEEGICFAPQTINHRLTVDPGSLITWEGSLQFFLAFIGGLLLNLMPCVFPLIGIKAMSLARISTTSSKKRGVNSFAYALGIETAMLLAALLILVAGWFGASAGWGLHFQNPAFIVLTGAILWALALSLWGLYTIPVLGFSGKGETAGGSFITGLFAVLAAAPCTAPFLGGALAYALALPQGLAIPFFLSAGAGFALPYVLLGLIPGLAKKLPKPGAWMESFERIMGFLMAGTALYILSPIINISGYEGVKNTAIILFILSLVFFIAGRWASVAAPTLRRRLIWVFGWLVILGTGYFLMPEPLATVEQKSQSQDLGWETFSTLELLKLRSASTPVFIDIWAEWCSNCKINEANVLSRPDILSWIDGQGIMRMKGNYTLPDPEIASWLAENRRSGLPVYAYYPGNGGEPVFLPEILTKDILKQYLTASESP